MTTFREYCEARSMAVIVFLAAYYGPEWRLIMARNLRCNVQAMNSTPKKYRFQLDEHAVSKGFTFPTDILDKPSAFERNLRDELCVISTLCVNLTRPRNGTLSTDRPSPITGRLENPPNP